MSRSAIVLFEKNSNIPATVLLKDFEEICAELDMDILSRIEEKDKAGRYKCLDGSFSDVPFKDKPSRQVSFFIFDEPYDMNELYFDWYDVNIVFFRAIFFHYFYKREDLLLIATHELFKKYPEAKLWVEDHWFYTFEDIEKIAARPFDENWCYKNPKDL